MKEVPRVVFDTNILFSAVGWRGNPHQSIQAARQAKCLSVTCESILTELAEKLELKLGLDSAKARETTDEIRAFSKIVPISGSLKVIADDPDDDAIVECAVIATAQFIVSGDRHLLALGRYRETQILTAAEFLKLLNTGSTP